MYALVIGRAFPDEKTGMMGIFEFEQARALNKHGLKSVYAFCDTRSIKLLRKLNYVELNQDNVPVYGYHFPIGGMPQYSFDKLKTNRFKKILKKIVNNHGIPDIIHVHFPLLNINNDIWRLLKNFEKPIIITEHWTKVQNKTIESFRINLLKKVVEESDSFICVGAPLKKSVIELTNTNKSIYVVPNMVSPLFYYERQLSNTDTFNFTAVGRLVEVKRFGLVIQAFAKAFPNIENIHLNIVGGGPLYPDLKKQINNMGLNNRVNMHGFLSREETAEIIRKSDAYVSASVLETFGVPFIEAMVSGLPVIGVKNGPIDNYINHSNGILFEKDNLDHLVNSLQKLYENRKKYDNKQIAFDAEQIFSEVAVTEKLKDIYKQHTKIKL